MVKTDLLKNPNPAGLPDMELISPPKEVWALPKPCILADPPLKEWENLEMSL